MTRKKRNQWIRSGVAAGLLLSGAASAATITVNTADDEINVDGDCSLREAVQAAETDTAVDACAAGSGADTIDLPDATYGLTLTGAGENAGATGDLDVSTEITLRGTTLAGTVIDGQGADRIAEVLAGGKLTLTRLTVKNGNTTRGGALYNAGELDLNNVIVRDSHAIHGGGVYNVGVLSAINSQFLNNTAQGLAGSAGGGSNGLQGAGGGGSGLGGGLFHGGSSALISGCTFNANVARGGAGGNANAFGSGAGGAIGGGAGAYGAAGGAATDLGGGGGGGGGGFAGNWQFHAGGTGSLGGGAGGGAVDFIGVNGGGGGGAGLGGGVFAKTGGLTLNASVIDSNSSVGGTGGAPSCVNWGQCGGNGTQGAGLGGGVYVLGNPVVFTATQVFSNTSDSDPNCQQVDAQTGGVNNPSFDGGRCNVAFSSTPGSLLTHASTEPAGANCPNGGQKLDVGFDADGNGTLSSSEVSSTSYLCSSAPSSLINVTAASTTDCPNGGQKFEVGGDDDANGALDGAEVDTVQFVCDGANGTNGLTSLSTSTPEPAGVNCANGGTKLQFGLDDDGNGVLDPAEVDSSAYACNGIDGLSVITSVTAEPAGANCTNGGQKIEVGQDADRNGQLDASEVQGTSYVCNGIDGSNGANGADGKQTLIDITTEPAGANCAEGGQKLDYGVDDDGNGQLDAAEIDGTRYLCSGLTGQNGHSTLVTVEAIPAGDTCTNGGQSILTGVDANDDGVLDAAEVTGTTSICNGAPGEQGEKGDQGEPGANGVDGKSSLMSVEAATAESCPAGGQTVKTGLDANGNGTLDAEEVSSSIDVCQSSCTVKGGGDKNTVITCSDGTSSTINAGGCSAVGDSSSLMWLLSLVGLPLIRRRRRA